jgi:agmatinase
LENKEDLIRDFNPNTAGKKGALFGLPFTPETSELIIIPIPWEVTVSYSAGTADGPQAILEASAQVDLFVKNLHDAWKLGMCMLPIPKELQQENQRFRDMAAKYIGWLEEGTDKGADEMKVIPQTINEVCEKLNIYVKNLAMKYLNQGKMVALLGGDHSTPLGMIRAMAEKHDSFGVLQIDAHADLREAYEDFEYSHASISYNFLKLKQIEKLVQVGIRDFCEEEARYIARSQGRVVTFFDEDIKEAMYEGSTWMDICQQVVEHLPQKVYITFDIDGLDPKLCPHTGTPVAGGFEFHQAAYLIREVVRSGRTIIGFDLNEVAPGEDEWDANVGARMLWHMSLMMAVSQGKLSMD